MFFWVFIFFFWGFYWVCSGDTTRGVVLMVVCMGDLYVYVSRYMCIQGVCASMHVP